MLIVDDLTPLETQLEDFARESGVVVFPTKQCPDPAKCMVWDNECRPFEDFLAAVKSLTKIVYLSRTFFDENDLDGCTEDPTLATDDSITLVSPGAMESARAHLGQIAEISLYYRFEGYTHLLTVCHSWYDDWVCADITDDSDAPKEADDDVSIDEWAQKLASAEQFADTKTIQDRMYLLKQLSEGKISEMDMHLIVREAASIHTISSAADQRKKVKALQDKGLDAAEISKKLGLTKTKVASLMKHEDPND
jgi:hypothetical protein